MTRYPLASLSEPEWGECDGTQNAAVQNCIFDGPSGTDGKSIGYIIFRPMVYDIMAKDNFFIGKVDKEIIQDKILKAGKP